MGRPSRGGKSVVTLIKTPWIVGEISGSDVGLWGVKQAIMSILRTQKVQTKLGGVS